MDVNQRRDLLLKLFILFILLLCPCIGESNNIIQQIDSVSQEIERTALYKGAEAKANINALYKIAETYPNDSRFYMRTLYLETYFNNVQGVTDSTLISRIKTSLDLCDRQKYPFEKALLHYTLALGYYNVGNYSDAFVTGLQALEEFKPLNDRKFIMKTYNSLGNICSSIKSDNMAEDYYKQAQAYLDPSQIEYYSSRSNVYMTWSHSSIRRQEAIDSLLSLLPIFEEKKEIGLQTVILLNIGTCYQINGELEKAYSYFQYILDFMQYIDNNRLKFSLYQSLGNYYYASENDLKSALYYYMLAKDIATEDKNLEFLSNVMFHLSELYAKLGHQDSAYYYLSNYSHINNQLTNNAKAIEAYKSYISVFLESSENELKIAEQTILLKSRHIVITVILALTLIALVVFFLILVQQKKKHKEAENYDLEMRLQQELKIQQLREDKIESQVREISSYSLLLSNKDNILQQIVDVSKCKPETKEEIAENYEKINQIIKNNLNTDNDWHNFMLHFEKLHPHFFEKLKSYSNDLTKTNLKMCAYFRVGVSTKEIAQIMNIAPDTIKVTRHRLKKKLGLKEDNNLDDFLRNL